MLIFHLEVVMVISTMFVFGYRLAIFGMLIVCIQLFLPFFVTILFAIIHLVFSHSTSILTYSSHNTVS